MGGSGSPESVSGYPDRGTYTDHLFPLRRSHDLGSCRLPASLRGRGRDAERVGVGSGSGSTTAAHSPPPLPLLRLRLPFSAFLSGPTPWASMHPALAPFSRLPCPEAV